MLAAESKKRQEQLNGLLEELSKKVITEDSCDEYITKFRGIYSNRFRHSYSKLHLLLVKMSNFEDEKLVPEFLITNLNLISKHIEDKYVEKGTGDHTRLYPSILKLCDHINLEQSRISEQQKQQLKMEDLRRDLNSAQVALEEATQKADVATEKASHMQTDILAVLSIFSAVVLAFMGGMTFLGGAMESIENVRVYKFIIACCICGIVIFNTIFVLLYIVSKIIGKSIYVRCNSEDCTCDHGKPKCSTIKRIRKRLPYVFYFNVLMIAFIIMTSFVQYTKWGNAVISFATSEQTSMISSQSTGESSTS